ncbi:hypothetical protein [Alishewanella sp. HH-ZS]|uniref:hypothetical protein n=1 Tax=Alishewanella sp. HH-ZS TaxID=1856684 RepID=UPI0011479402|nr:hypothetical protein [Alishewanella sp. HH-ZS]
MSQEYSRSENEIAYYEEGGRLIRITARSAVNKGKSWRTRRVFYAGKGVQYLKLVSRYTESRDLAQFVKHPEYEGGVIPDPSLESESIEHEEFKSAFRKGVSVRLRIILPGKQESDVFKVWILNSELEYEFGHQGKDYRVDARIKIVDDNGFTDRFGTVLGIEICKSHKVPARKKKDLFAFGLPTVEIFVPKELLSPNIQSAEDENKYRERVREYVSNNVLDADFIATPYTEFASDILKAKRSYKAKFEDSQRAITDLKSNSESLRSELVRAGAELKAAIGKASEIAHRLKSKTDEVERYSEKLAHAVNANKAFVGIEKKLQTFESKVRTYTYSFYIVIAISILSISTILTLPFFFPEEAKNWIVDWYKMMTGLRKMFE